MKTNYYLFISILCCCIPKFNFAQSYVWAKSLEGRGISTLTNLTPGTSFAEALVVDSLGNTYITGFSNDTVDFDPGPNEVLLHAGNDDVYLAKYDKHGNYLWAHVFESVGGNYGTKLKLDHQGNIILAGYARNTADFDPSSNVALLGNIATPNYVFIAKYTANGNYIWGKEIGNNFGTMLGGLDIDNNNNIHITGHFYGTIDMDPSASEALLISNETGIYTAKYDANGNYLWSNCLSHVGNLGESMTITCSKNGYVYVGGIFGNTVDFDPSANTLNLTANTTCDRFIMKYNSFGDLMWAQSFNVNEDGYLNADRIIKMAIDNDGNIILIGNFTGTVDLDPGPAVFTIFSPQTSSSYFCKFTPAGQLIWAKGLIGGVVQTTDLAIDCENNICIAGSFGSADFDPSSTIFQFQSTAPSAFNNFYSKYNSSGNLIWVKQIGNNGYGGSTFNINIALNSGYLHVAGGFKQTGYFSPDGTVPLVAKGVGHNTFFAKYNFLNVIDNLHDTTLCQGQKITLDASAVQGNYIWQDQSTMATLEVVSAGNYWVEITSQNCKIVDSVKVTINTIYPLNTNDTTICEGETLILNTNNQLAQYLWQNNDTTASIVANNAGVYWVKISNGFCTLIDTVNINTQACTSELIFPNIFTPNSDGFNEAFVPIKIKGIVQSNLNIYNRWGQIVYETSDLQEGWDGKINNKPASAGVYFYIVNYTTIDDKEQNLNGFLTLMN